MEAAADLSLDLLRKSYHTFKETAKNIFEKYVYLSLPSISAKPC